MGDLVKNLVIWTVIAVVIMSLFTGVGGRNTASQEFNYTDFMQQVQTGQVEEVTIAGREISGSFKSGETFRTYSPETDNSALVGELIKGKVRISGKAPEKQSFLAQIFIHWFPFLLVFYDAGATPGRLRWLKRFDFFQQISHSLLGHMHFSNPGDCEIVGKSQNPFSAF